MMALAMGVVVCEGESRDKEVGIYMLNTISVARRKISHMEARVCRIYTQHEKGKCHVSIHPA